VKRIEHLEAASTQLKCNEGALRERERRFQGMFHNISDLITVIGADGTVRYENNLAAERLLGYRPEEKVETNAFKWIHPDDVERALSLFAEVLSKPGVHPPIEFGFRTKMAPGAISSTPSTTWPTIRTSRELARAVAPVVVVALGGCLELGQPGVLSEAAPFSVAAVSPTVPIRLVLNLHHLRISFVRREGPPSRRRSSGTPRRASAASPGGRIRRRGSPERRAARLCG
jgi:PAS domain S-box-containing protein